ncbi:MAG: DUF2202 domain-containing protein [Gammaproteobacteria bacterium]|nr:MAG: DUF2202 domain-containing protein [Gammaproteobacteria bacterium]
MLVLILSTSGCNTDQTPEQIFFNSTSDSTVTLTDSETTSNTSSEDETTTDDTDTTSTGSGVLDLAEATHLIFIREEEKLARDVYMTLSTLYPSARIFVNIGEGSEQTHTDMVRDKLEAYGIPDPNPDTNNLPTSIGVYTGEEFGGYFTEKYVYLIEVGSRSELDALYVGAFIEELDMHDIVECPDYIEDSDNGIDECGMEYTDEQPLINTYSTLVDGSKNHLRSFVGQIEAIIGEGNYVAQVISQEEVDEILGR